MEKETKKEIEKETNDRIQYLYRDALPEEILAELPEEVKKQYFLWDEIMKREIQLYPWLILPVVKELFHREYPEDGDIVLLSTEYIVSRIHEKGRNFYTRFVRTCCCGSSGICIILSARSRRMERWYSGCWSTISTSL